MADTPRIKLRGFGGKPPSNPLLEHLRDTYSPNPLDPREIVINDESAIEITPLDKDTARLNAVRALEKGSGAGSRTLDLVGMLADRFGTTLEGSAEPFGKGGLDKQQLIEFYRRHGWVSSEDNPADLFREPRSPDKSKLPKAGTELTPVSLKGMKRSQLMNLAERIGYDGSAAGQKTGQKTFGSLMTKIVRQIGFVGKNPLEIRFELGFTESMVDDLETAYERGINTFRNRGTRPEGSQTAVPTEDLETFALDLYREWHRSGFSEPWERARAQELSNIVEELSERHARTPFDVARDLKGRAGVGDTPQITGRDKSKLPAVIDAASVAAEAARLGADESRPKGKGASFRGLGSLARSPIFKVARLVQEGYNLLPEDYKVIEDWVDRMKKTQTHELFGMDKPGIEYLKEWLGVEQTSPTESAADTPESRELRGKLFQELANKQRDAPELLMVEAQGVLGGGVLSHAIEHTGDLTHRIADKYDAFDGYGYDVGNKVDKVLRSLRSEYGFEKEFNENIRAASSYRGIPEKRLRDAATKALQKYADAHKSLRVYNEPQKWARDAAVALGEQRFTDAREHLSKLQNLIRGEGGPAQSGENISEAYRRAAGEFNPDFEDLKPERKASGGFVDKPLYDDARIGGMI